MKRQYIPSRLLLKIIRNGTAVLCAALLAPGETPLPAQSQQATGSTQSQATKVPPDQLDSLVAPIALYPDPMLAQMLAASTYPLEIIQLQQWLQKNKNLKDKALADAVAKQPWDPSVQALAALPDVVKRLADDIQWTTDLGNAFLAQQSDVMDAVQRMRKKAQDKGNLKSTEQQKVETKVIENKSVIVVQQANPQVVYVPSYDPVVVYGPPIYPYPPIYYPPYGYYAAGMAISFGVGVMMGAFWSGGWGWGCGWGGNDIDINVNNNFNRNSNINRGTRPTNPIAGTGNRGNVGGGLVGLVVRAALAGWVALAVLAGSVVLVVLAALVALVALVELVGLAVPAGLVGLAVPAGLVGSVVLGAATNGNTVRNIVAALRTKTAPPRTDSGARRGATLFPIARRTPVNKLAGKAAIWPATEAEPALAIGLAEEPVSATEAEPA